ncbi:hypothetical protein ACFQO7_19145 [Catellatospora aurea]|uniref:Uncharacterized protein n=1 Tax=Catellatospora aurea TaxID=1337874 RepID=A0ABW2H0X0_9ACTN
MDVRTELQLAAIAEIKQMMPVWVPGLPRRDKDRADIELLTAALTGRNPFAGSGATAQDHRHAD